MESYERSRGGGQENAKTASAEAMKTGRKEKIKYILKYIINSFMEAVLLVFKLIKDGFKRR